MPGALSRRRAMPTCAAFVAPQKLDKKRQLHHTVKLLVSSIIFYWNTLFAQLVHYGAPPLPAHTAARPPLARPRRLARGGGARRNRRSVRCLFVLRYPAPQRFVLRTFVRRRHALC